MLRGYLPEFLFAIVMSILLLFGYAMRGSIELQPPRVPHVEERVRARFLLQVEGVGGAPLTVATDGRLQGGKRRGSLTQTELIDLREVVGQLAPDPGAGGSARLRFYDSAGAHELSFDPARPQPAVGGLLKHLRILQILPSR